MKQIPKGLLNVGEPAEPCHSNIWTQKRTGVFLGVSNNKKMRLIKTIAN